MRVLRVAQKVYPDVTGGGPYHVHAMSRDQADMGHDVTVLTTRDDESLPKAEERSGYEIVRVQKGVTVAGNDLSPSVARYLWKYADDYDVVHAHSHLYFSTNVASVVRRIGNVPLAITNHGLYSQSAPEWVFDVYLRTLGRWTFDQADVVFCYTKTEKRRLGELGVRSRIEVVSNGIDTERFSPEGPGSELIESAGPVVLFVGRLVEGKRPDVAMEAFATVLEEHPGAELYLCGEGSLRGELERQALNLGIASSITFLGYVPYDEMPAVYRSADALVLPSRTEGLPRTVLEALATNVSVVVSDLEQVQPIVNGGGKTVPVGDVDGFARALESVLSADYDPRQIVKEDIAWSDTVRRTTDVLASL